METIREGDYPQACDGRDSEPVFALQPPVTELRSRMYLFYAARERLGYVTAIDGNLMVWCAARQMGYALLCLEMCWA
jgi:hypothetical protein